MFAETRVIRLAKLPTMTLHTPFRLSSLRFFAGLFLFVWVLNHATAFALPETGTSLSSSESAEEQKKLPANTIALNTDLVGNINLENRTEVKDTLDAINKELAELLDTDPLKEVKQSMLNLQMDILQKQLSLLDDLKRQEELKTLVSANKLEKTREIRDQAVAALQGLNPAKEIFPLTQIPKIEELQQVVARDYEQPLPKAKNALDQTTEQLNQLTAELANLPQLIAEAQKSHAEMQAKLTELQQTIPENSDLPIADRQSFTHHSDEIRKESTYYYQKRLDYLEQHGQILEQLVVLYKLLQEADEMRYQRARVLNDAAQDYLKERLAAESHAAQTQLQRKQDELQRVRAEYQKIYKTEDVAIQQIEAEHKAHLQTATPLEEKLDQIRGDLDKARHQLETYRQIYRRESDRSSPPSSEEVANTITQLLEESDRMIYLRERTANLERQRHIETKLATIKKQLATLETDFTTKIEKAKTAFAQYLTQHEESSITGGDWENELQKWNELKAHKMNLLRQEQETLEQMLAILRELYAVSGKLYDTRRETILLLRRENLFLRGRSKITWDAISSGVGDLPLLPDYLIDATQAVVAYLMDPKHRPSLELYVSSIALIGLILLTLRHWMTQRVQQLLHMELTTLPARTVLTMTYLARALCLATFFFLAFYLAAIFLADLPEGVMELLYRLGLVLGTFWFGRIVNRELFHPDPSSRAVINFDPRTATHVWAYTRLLLYLSVIFIPINLALFYLGYPNEGAVEFLWALYEVSVVIVLMALLIRRSLILNLLPSSNKPLVSLFRFIILVLYSVFVLLVPTLFILSLLQFDILAGLITGLSVTILAASLAGYLIYYGLCFALNRFLEKTFSEHEEDEEVERRFRASSELARFGLRVVIIFGAVFFILAFHGATFRDIRTFLDAPLPLQGINVERQITWWNLFFSGLLLTLFLLTTRYLKLSLKDLILPRTKLDTGTQYAIIALLGYALVGFGVYLALTEIFDLQKLGYIVAALSVGIGFGLQEIISNFISGLILLFERPLKVGDVVRVGDTEGVVQRINIRSTTVQTLDNISILVPNKDFITQNVINYVYGDPKIRIQIAVGVAYGSDVALVRKVLQEVAANHGLVLRRPPPEIRFIGFGDSSLDFLLLVWVGSPSDRFRIASDLTFAIDAAFRRYAIEIPFPQRDLHLRSAEPIRVVYDQPAATDGSAGSADTKIAMTFDEASEKQGGTGRDRPTP